LKHLAAHRNVAVIETYAENSIDAQSAIMPGHSDDAVEARRLHISALVRQELIVDQTGLEVEVVVHVFGVHAEQAVEVYAASGHPMQRVPDVAADIAAANAQSAASRKVKPIET
jgi:hypothetical protein